MSYYSKFIKILAKKGLIKDSYYGLCLCEKEAPYCNIQRNHWFHCDQCKTKWLYGSNLFSAWQEENEDTWRSNAQKIKDYREITPSYDSIELCINRFKRFFSKFF